MTTKSITTVLLAATLDIAWPMGRARENGVMSPYASVARFWERVGDVGEALEARVDRLATRWDIDISTYMMDRAYGD
jgi:hypothetical protein